MSTRLVAIELRREDDVVQARQSARDVAARLGFDSQDQVRIATAASELARNAYRYAGAGEVAFELSPGSGHLDQPQSLNITVSDNGPGIADLQRVLRGRYVSNTGLGIGLIGTQRLMDEFHVESEPGKGTRVQVGKKLSTRQHFSESEIRDIQQKLKSGKSREPLVELEAQNRDLLASLEQLRLKSAELDHLNKELDDTNRGVVALYAELDERADFLQRTSELKTRFLSNMSHEFRTPLNSIISLTQLLLDRVDGELTEEQEKQVTYIRRSADTLLELVTDLLDLAKIEAGKVTVRPSAFKVSALFGALRGMLRPLLTNPNVSLIFEEGPELDLYTDEPKVSQILRNFISNALKFTQAGTVVVSARGGQHDTVCFSVRDTGIGISRPDQLRVFEEFTQIDSPLQRQTKGTGLGLPITKKFAELLGGSVSLESEPGEGSTFSAIIPRVYSESVENSALGISTAPALGPRESTPVLLVIDDEEISRYVLRNLLRALAFRVLEANGAAVGLQLAETRRPAAIFLDLIMNGMQGEEALERLKANPATVSIPVIIHTSRVLSAAEKEQLLRRAVAIVPKQTKSRDESFNRIQQALALAGISLAASKGEA
ncbi:MAG TPA: ATP-binding protein [Candidatus Koribacter sp.]|jgi:signal transduction histidine kinase